MSAWKSSYTTPTLIIAAGLVLGAGGVWASLNKGQFAQHSGLMLPDPVVRTVSMPDSTAMGALQSLDSAFADLAQQAEQSVVSIKSQHGRVGGQGSGFIYSSDGWIVTNDHVVGDADTVEVTLNDGRTLTGKVTRANDDQIDLAMVKIDANNLPAVKLADSETVRPGEFTMAIGSPFGLENTVTIGHVSALGRGSVVPDQMSGEVRGYTGMIQTDASINPGNSGGPLMNINGEVIGVNSTIYSTNMTSAGIGFAIPSNVVNAVANEIKTTGKFDRGLIGAEIDDLKPYQKKEMGIEGGAIVLNAPKDQPAYKAGIRDGDVITRIDGTPLRDQMDLRIALYEKSPKQTVTLTYKRDGAFKDTTLTLAAPQKVVAQQQQPRMQAPNGFDDFFNQFGQPFDRSQRGNGNGNQGSPMQHSGPVTLGVTVRAIDPTVTKQFGLPAGTTGVAVMSVAPGSFAETAGLQSGDVITGLNGKSITGAQSLRDGVSQLQWGDEVRLDYMRVSGGVTTKGTIQMPIE